MGEAPTSNPESVSDTGAVRDAEKELVGATQTCQRPAPAAGGDVVNDNCV